MISVKCKDPTEAFWAAKQRWPTSTTVTVTSVAGRLGSEWTAYPDNWTPAFFRRYFHLPLKIRLRRMLRAARRWCFA